MLKLPKKLRIFRAQSGLKNPDIALATGACLQSVVNWASDKRCPSYLEKHYAIALVALSDGYITMKDCGHETT